MKRLPLAAAMAAFFVFLLWSVAVRQAALFLVGIGLGAALAGARFGFTTGWRRLVEERDPRGVVGQLLLLGLQLNTPRQARIESPTLGEKPQASGLNNWKRSTLYWGR